jgi:hypothetical protein
VGSNDGSITSCCSTGSISGDQDVGGLVGFNYGGSITMSYSTGTVTGNESVGGLVGESLGGGFVARCIITASYSTGSVSGNSLVGGLVGRHSGGSISTSYSTGTVNGDHSVGGLVGRNEDSITTSYSTGQVYGASEVGGLVGANSHSDWWGTIWGSATSSFWDMEASGLMISDAGIGKTTAQMQTAGTFLTAGWDFAGESENGTEDIWTICEGIDYPRFTWRFVIVDFDGDYDTDFADFCILAERWRRTDGSFWCGQGCDLTDDGNVDFDDLKEFADNWLTEGAWRSVVRGFIVLDNFEHYNDYPPNRIFETWIDGYGYSEPAPGKEGNGTGSTVGYLNAPFAEQTIVHGGRQSMPFGYDNTRLPYYSEAEREYLVAQNFMSKGVKSMSLWIYGDPGNAPSEVYVGLEDSTGIRVNVAETNTNLVRVSAWQEINIELAKFGPVNLVSIKKVYIGAGDRDDPKPGGKGALYIDDIVLY